MARKPRKNRPLKIGPLKPGEAVYLPEVLFEFLKVGKSYRVVAIDPITRTEVTMVAPVKASKEDIKKIAARKLAYVIGKKAAAERDDENLD